MNTAFETVAARRRCLRSHTPPSRTTGEPRPQWELDEHRKERLVRAFDYLKGPAKHKVAATELLHYGRDARFIFFHLCGILDFANID